MVKHIKTRENPVKLLAVILLMLLLPGAAMAQSSESKSIRKGFKSAKSSVVEITNKYGDVSIETWDKDSVIIEINIEINDKSQEKVRDKLKAINFDLSQSGNYIVLSTLIGDSRNPLVSEFTKLKENIGVSDSRVEIDMNIKMPDNLSLKINNKFGNVYISGYNGDVKIDMSNGKLKAQQLMGYTNIKLSFGDAIIDKLDAGNIEIYYGELNLTSARKLRMTTKTSNITITEIGQLIVTSSRDEYRIRMVDNFETEANWTDFSISELRQGSDVKMNYGDLTIDKVLPSAENILVDARSTKINLYLDPRTEINFDISSTKPIKLPSGATIESKTLLPGEEKQTQYIGHTSKATNENPKIVIKAYLGDITVVDR